MKHPFEQKTQWQMINSIQIEDPLKFPNNISPSTKDLLKHLLEKNPD
jgi:hypothetical protein